MEQRCANFYEEAIQKFNSDSLTTNSAEFLKKYVCISKLNAFSMNFSGDNKYLPALFRVSIDGLEDRQEKKEILKSIFELSKLSTDSQRSSNNIYIVMIYKVVNELINEYMESYPQELWNFVHDYPIIQEINYDHIEDSVFSEPFYANLKTQLHIIQFLNIMASEENTRNRNIILVQIIPMLINTIRLDCEANRSESVKTCIASFINNCPKATFFIFSCFLKGYKAGQKEISPKTLDQLCMENNQLCMEKNGGCLTAEEGINLIQNETERIASIPYFVEADVVIPIIKNLNIENPNVRDMMYNIIKSYLKYTFYQPTEFTVKYNKAKEMLAILNEGFKEKPVLQNLVKGVINDCNAILVGEYVKHVLFLKQSRSLEIESNFDYTTEQVYEMGLRCFTGRCLADNLDFGGLSEFFPLLLDMPYFKNKTIKEILRDENLQNILAFWNPRSQHLEQLKDKEFKLCVLSDRHRALAINVKDCLYMLDSLADFLKRVKEDRFSFKSVLKELPPKIFGNQTIFQNPRNYMSCSISTILSLKAVLNVAFKCKEERMDFETKLQTISKSFCEFNEYLKKNPKKCIELQNTLKFYLDKDKDSKYNGLFLGLYMLMTQELEKLLHNADKIVPTIGTLVQKAESEADMTATSSAAAVVSPSSALILRRPMETHLISEQFKNLFQNPDNLRIAIDDMQTFIECFKKIDLKVFKECPAVKKIANFMLDFELLRETDLKPEILTEIKKSSRAADSDKKVGDTKHL